MTGFRTHNLDNFCVRQRIFFNDSSPEISVSILAIIELFIIALLESAIINVWEGCNEQWTNSHAGANRLTDVVPLFFLST